MRTAEVKINKLIKCRARSDKSGAVKLKYPKQSLGNIIITFEGNGQSKLLKHWEIFLHGDDLKVVKVK